MKKLSLFYLFAFLFGSLVVLNSCSDDDENDPTPDEENEFTVTANITTNTTWETGNVYILAGRIAVTSGATLTIQP